MKKLKAGTKVWIRSSLLGRVQATVDEKGELYIISPTTLPEPEKNNALFLLSRKRLNLFQRLWLWLISRINKEGIGI
jgi:hypothetical protein